MSWTRRTGAGERGSERGTIGGRAGDDRGGQTGLEGRRSGDGEQGMASRGWRAGAVRPDDTGIARWSPLPLGFLRRI